MNSHIAHRVISIISEPPSERSEKDILELIPHLTAKVFAIGGISQDAMVDVLKNAKHRKLRKNTLLKKSQGSSDRLYIVLTGGLSMFMEYQEGGLPAIRNKDGKTRAMKQFGFRVDSFGPGKVIEERYRLETVNIITDADTDLMVISKNLYERAMQSKLQRESEEKELFIKTHPFFSKWSESKQNSLKSAFVKKAYKNNERVIVQGQEFSGIYFITKGRAKLSTEPRKHKRQYEEMFEEKDLDEELLEILRLHVPKKMDTMVSRGDTKGSHMDDKTYVKRLDGYVAAEKMMFQKLIDVSVVSGGEIFGDLEFLLNLPTNVFTVTSMSEGCEALILPKHELERFLTQKKTPFSLRLMKFLSETKLVGRLSSTQGQKVPLLPKLLYRLRKLRVDVPKSKLTIVNDLEEELEKKKTSKDGIDKVKWVEELDKSFLRQSFLKDKGPFLKPFTPGTVYFKEIMRMKNDERVGFKGHMEKFKIKEPEKEQSDYYTINKRLKQSILENVKESIKSEKVIKKLSLSWNKESLNKL